MHAYIHTYMYIHTRLSENHNSRSCEQPKVQVFTCSLVDYLMHRTRFSYCNTVIPGLISCAGVTWVLHVYSITDVAGVKNHYRWYSYRKSTSSTSHTHSIYCTVCLARMCYLTSRLLVEKFGWSTNVEHAQKISSNCSLEYSSIMINGWILLDTTCNFSS